MGEPATGGTRSGRFLESGAGLRAGGFGPRRPRGGAGLQPPGKGSASSDPSTGPGRSETPRRTPGAVGQPRQGGDHRLPGSWGAALNLRRPEAPKAKTRSGGSRAPSSPGPTCGRSLHFTPSGTPGLCLRDREEVTGKGAPGGQRPPSRSAAHRGSHPDSGRPQPGRPAAAVAPLALHQVALHHRVQGRAAEGRQRSATSTLISSGSLPAGTLFPPSQRRCQVTVPSSYHKALQPARAEPELFPPPTLRRARTDPPPRTRAFLEKQPLPSKCALFPALLCSAPCKKEGNCMRPTRPGLWIYPGSGKAVIRTDL